MALRPLVRAASVGALGLTTLATTAGVAEAAPAADYQMPFSCGQEWTGSTRSYHSPSSNAVDFNRPDDLGKSVTAAAPGVVSSVTDLGGRSYGLYVKISHGSNESTLYAHLKAAYVVEGQRVDQGQLIAALGTSGGSTGPHLHFEERYGSKVVTPYFHGIAYRMPKTSLSENCVNVPLAGDWNNGGRDNPGVFERQWNGQIVQKVGRRVTRITLGRGLDWPLVGDWDGDGTTDVGVRRALGGRFLLRRSDGTVDRSLRLGGRRHVGVAGDWDGDGTTDIGIWRPRDGDFRLRLSNGRFRRVSLGSASSLPVTGDFDGDGRSDVGVFDPLTATWSWTRVGGPAGGTVRAGNVGELPVTGDWNGDGKTDLATWNRDTGVWTRYHEASGTPRRTTRRFGAQP